MCVAVDDLCSGYKITPVRRVDGPSGPDPELDKHFFSHYVTYEHENAKAAPRCRHARAPECVSV